MFRRDYVRLRHLPDGRWYVKVTSRVLLFWPVLEYKAWHATSDAAIQDALDVLSYVEKKPDAPKNSA
jgi:hypothetical protein